MATAGSKYKSEAWLEKYGWSRGQGLGAAMDGRTDIVRVSFKDDTAGKKSYELKDFSHWDNLFNSAAKKLNVAADADGVKVTSTREPVAPKPSPYAGMFVKSSNMTSMAEAKVYGEKDLYSLCGERNLRLYGQKGKEKRIKDAESKPLSASDEALKKDEEPRKTKKRKRTEDDMAEQPSKKDTKRSKKKRRVDEDRLTKRSKKKSSKKDEN